LYEFGGYCYTDVSIHAPREGSDRLSGEKIPAVPGFNPRPPRGERRKDRRQPTTKRRFQSTPPERGATHQSGPHPESPPVSIHAPREGSDEAVKDEWEAFKVSIHAPREGSDLPSHPLLQRAWCFNPRPPRGERPISDVVSFITFLFQSTPPERGATRAIVESGAEATVSIHAPREGSDNINMT